MATDMTPKNVGCAQLIPSGNLNADQAGSFGNMMAALNNGKKKFQAKGTNGFTPGFDTKGLNGVEWDCLKSN